MASLQLKLERGPVSVTVPSVRNGSQADVPLTSGMDGKRHCAAPSSGSRVARFRIPSLGCVGLLASNRTAAAVTGAREQATLAVGRPAADAKLFVISMSWSFVISMSWSEDQS